MIPAEAEAPRSGPPTYVLAERPKLVFSRLVQEFFGELVAPGWPVDGGSVADDAVIDPSVSLAPGVVIGRGVVLNKDVHIGPHTCLCHTTVEAGAEIGAHCSIGLTGYGFDRDADGTLIRFPHVGRVRIGEGASIGSNTCIDRGGLGETRIGDGAKVDNLVHVAHNVQIGPRAMVIAHAMLGGSATVESDAWIAPNASIINQKTVGEGAVVGLGAVVVKDVEAGATVVGNPARPLEKR